MVGRAETVLRRADYCESGQTEIKKSLPFLMDWQGLLFIDISVCMVIYIIVILPLFIISRISGKSIGFRKLFRLWLKNSIDYQLKTLSTFKNSPDYPDYAGAGASDGALVESGPGHCPSKGQRPESGRSDPAPVEASGSPLLPFWWPP